MALNNLRNPLAPLQRNASAGRILERRHGINKLNAMRRNHFFQRFRHKAVVIHCHADILRLIRIERLKRAEIRRRFDGDLVAGRNQRFAKRVKHALRAARNQNLIHRRQNPLWAQIFDQRFAQRRKAFGQIILKRGRAVFVNHALRQFPHFVHREALRRGNASGQRHHAGLRHHFQNFADHVDAHNARPVCQ